MVCFDQKEPVGLTYVAGAANVKRIQANLIELGMSGVDVIEARKVFVQYFLIHKQSCYLISAGNNPEWIIPQNNPTILLCMSFIYWILQ